MGKSADALSAYLDEAAAPAKRVPGAGLDSYLDDLENQPAPPAPPASAGVLRTIADMGIKGAQGVVDLGQSVVGIGSLATGGLAGKAMRSIGYDPERTNQALGELLSPQQQAQEREVQDAKGFVDTLVAAAKNPRAVAGSVVESLPAMFGIGGITSAVARRIALRAAAPLGGITTEAGAKAAQEAIDAASGKLMTASGAAEGAQSAGQIADQAQAAGRGYKDYALPAVASGVLTGAITRGAGAVMGDATTALFSGSKTAGAQGSLPARLLKSATSEGVLQEMPQSAEEQVMTNIAMGKPDVWEGVGNQAAMGLVTGAVMGVGEGAMSPHQQAKATADTVRATETVPEVGVLSAAANVGTEAKAQIIENSPPVAAPAPEPAPVDPVLEKLKRLTGDAKQEALHAYNIINRPDVAKGVVQYNKKLLDKHLAGLDEQGAPTNTPPNMLLAGQPADPVQELMVQRRDEETTRQNLANWMKRAEPMALDRAQDIKAQATERGMSMEVVPHGAGQGFTVVPSAWMAPNMRGEVPQDPDTGLLPLDTQPTGVLRADAAGNVAPETGAQRIDTTAAQQAIDAEAQRKADLGLTPDVEAAVKSRNGTSLSRLGPDAAAVDQQSGVQAMAAGSQSSDGQPAGRADGQAGAGKRGGASAGSPVQRGQPAAGAPAAVAGDILAKSGKPFASKLPASNAAKKAGPGHSVVPVDGGFVVRKDSEWQQFPEHTGTLGIPRADMPQIKAEHRGPMVNFLEARGVPHEIVEVDPKILKPSQAEYSPAKAEESAAITDSDRSILISSDGYVLDGHHQWLAAGAAGKPVKAIRLDAPAAKLLPLIKEFPSAQTAQEQATEAAAAPVPAPAADTAPAAVQPAGSGAVVDAGKPGEPDAALKPGKFGSPEHLEEGRRMAAEQKAAGEKDAGYKVPDDVGKALRKLGAEPTATNKDTEWELRTNVGQLGDVVIKFDPTTHVATIEAQHMGKTMDTRTAEGAPAIAAAVERARDGLDAGTMKMAREYFAKTSGLSADETKALPDKEGDAAMFSLSAAGYDAAVDKAIKLEIQGENEELQRGAFGVGPVPQALRLGGVGEGPLMTSGSIIGKAHIDHGVTKANLKNIPTLVARPVLIFKSDTQEGNHVVVTNVWMDDRPLTVIIKPSKTTSGTAFNFIPSVYPREQVASIGTWIEKGLLTYIDQEQSPQWFSSARLQLPRDLRTTKGLQAKSVATNEDLREPDGGRASIGKDEAGDTLTPIEIQAEVSRLTGSWLRKPDIHVLETMAEAPGPVFRQWERQYSEGAKGAIEGFHYRGGVYLVAETMNSEQDVARVLFHEALGHFGLRNVFGDTLKPILLQIAAMRATEMKAKAEQYGLNLSKPEERLIAAEEVLAEMAQTRPEIGYVKRAIAAIRTWLRENIPGFKDLALTDDEIISNYLLPARGFVERGTQAGPSFASNDDVMFSRAVDPRDASTFADRARDAFHDVATTQKTFGWWNKTIGTQYQKAAQDKHFKRAFDATQGYILDVSRLANDAADRARDLLPRLENLRDVLKDIPGIDKNATSKADVTAIAKPVFQGTLSDKREYKAEELRRVFKLNDKQVGLYQQMRAAVNKSLDDLTTSTAAKLLRYSGIVEDMIRDELDQGDHEGLAQFAAGAAAQDPSLQGMADQVREISDRAKQLKAEGYAPLMRFGQYAVSVRDAKTGDLLEFHLFENNRQANAAARKLASKGKVEQSVMSKEDYKLLQGVSPESLELFGDILEKAGMFDTRDELYQTYLRKAIDQRSAMKRMIEREGYPGYSQDVRRVLATFVTSNARLAAKNLHYSNMLEAVENIPKSKGDVKDEAVKLIKYVQEPVEEAPVVRGLLFSQFIGGSVASALVNTTQTLTMTYPYLSQFNNPGKAAKTVLGAMKQALGKVTGDLGNDLARAEQLGIVSPQEIHHLNAEAMATFGSHQAVQKTMFLWGSLFSLAEQYNRRVAFISAWNTAKDLGRPDAFEFAVKAVEETQGVYNKGNRPDWARGAIGATLFTFKQFSVSYLEFLSRLPVREKALALGILMLAAGAEGLPFADDLDDVIDTIAERLGYNFNSKQQKRRFIGSILGEGASNFLLKGFSSIPGVPIDVAGRMGMANLIPGTGLLRKDVKDHMQDILEIAGPVGSVVQSGAKVAGAGEWKEMFPTSIKNLIKAADMFQTGMYRDSKGRKVIDTDAVDATWKAIGFQPAEVAKNTLNDRLVQQQITMVKETEGEIADQMAQARFENDSDKYDAARARLAQWNADNPESPIKIGAAQLAQRLREMRSTRDQRIIKSAPREMRSEVRSQLQ